MQKTSKFPEASLKTWPYLQPMSFRSVSDLEEFARQQNQLAGESQKSFSERFEQLKAKGGSIRSFPTPPMGGLDESVVDMGLVQAVARASASDQRAAGAQAAAPVAAPSNLPQEFDPALLFEEMYEGVDIEPEFDKSLPQPPAEESAKAVTIDWSDASVGEITLYGKYPYQFKEENRKKNLSYVIRLGTENIWGVDLERIMREHKFKKGDRIALKCISFDRVTVPEQGHDHQGNEQIVLRPAKRKTWVAKRIG